ncbi:thioesterase [Micromonospora sp. KC207]|uniref:Thioesterase n=1 Tax=Micromonospora carbonacea TaxID=47853 RepID=A0A7D6GU11_9ACTN|nr:thioesterase [Micromonospora carbonacea]TDC58994.1 thioesterase [Micromonospora sp. KC207]
MWLRPLGPANPAAVRLLCLPHAGGSATYFRPLARELSATFEVVGVQYPGRQDRRAEPALRTIGELADGVFAACGVPDRPTVLFGHSMGAVIAFEVAQRIERADATHLLGLVCSGRRGPAVPGPDDVHRRSDAGLIQEVRELSGTSAGLLDDEEIVRMILPALRADYGAVETYRMTPGARLGCPVSILTGDADPRVSVPAARAWADVTDGGSRLRVLPGGHFFLDEGRAEVAAAIREGIAEFLDRNRPAAAPAGAPTHP